MKTSKYIQLLLCSALLLVACQKAPVLSITGPTNIELSADGSSGTITFTANRDWTISTSDSWVSVSPSRGEAADGQVTVTVRCGANTTYEDRTATVTIKMEELTQTVSMRQPANLGIVLPTQSYNLESDGRTINVEVQANVQYTVSTSVDWIKQTGTKGLTSTTYIFSVEENQTYDAREGTITIKSQNSSVADQVITVKQAQKDALIVKDKSFDMPYGGGEIEFKVEANVDFDVKPDVDWIHYLETKALSNSTVRLSVDENPTYEAREGKIEIKQKNGSLSHTITVKEAGRIAVISITLDQTRLTLKPEETATLVATVKPDNATDKTVTWSSSDTSIASVDENGTVTAIKDGTTTITAEAGEKSATCTIVVSSIIMFEDANFKAYCVAYFDQDGDGEISVEEALAVQEMDCSDRYIQSMVGVKSFLNLTKLNCSGNELTTLDLSGCERLDVLYCDRNMLHLLEQSAFSVDVSGCKSLTLLDCGLSGLTSLNVSGCTLLITLYCWNNPLSNLDLSGCVALENLYCQKNQLTSLILTGCKALYHLDCRDNQLTSLDVSECVSLNELNCYNNQLSSITLNDSLTELQCSLNRLTSLDVSRCKELYSLECSHNELESLDVSNNNKLLHLLCSSNKLTSLDLSGCKELMSLHSGSNQLTSLNIEGCEELLELLCSNNLLTSFTIRGCKEMMNIELSSNQLTSLSIIDCNIGRLECSKNKLTSLKLSDINAVNCDENLLTSLDVSACPELYRLSCSSNRLTSIDLSNCAQQITYLDTRENPGLTEIWLRTGQQINGNYYLDADITTIKYKN